MDAADKFNLLDIILTETDEENYCSASENDSKDSSSDDEWKQKLCKETADAIQAP